MVTPVTVNFALTLTLVAREKRGQCANIPECPTNKYVGKRLADIGIPRSSLLYVVPTSATLSCLTSYREGWNAVSYLPVSIHHKNPSRNYIMVVTTALKGALNDAITSGKFIDTKIVLFSRRDSSGRVCKPRALYANSHVLKTVPYFNALLSGQFSESEVKDFTEAIDNEEFAEDYGYSSDSDLEEDWDFESPAPPNRRTQPPRQDALYGQYKEHVQTGKVIRIQDVAFITFQAFLLYLYTNSMDFAPFGSEENRKSRSSEIAWTPEDQIPKPSPKSVYRLADKYDVPTLKGTALTSIKNGLRKCDIVRETFSVFTSRYNEIKVSQVKYLLKVWLSGGEEESKAVRAGLDEKIDIYAAGGLDHAVDVMSSIWEISNIVPVYGVSASRKLATRDTRFTGCDMRPSLIKSIKEGCLLDRKYWARRSRGGVVEPIYFPGTVSQAEIPRLDTLLGCQLGHEGHLDQNDDEYAEDSDYENEPDSTGHSISQDTEVDSERKREQKLLPVLSVGSQAAWTSLFFYLLTGKIRFAPLKSRGSEHRSKLILENAKPGGSPAPCSPKTIYLLVEKLQWKNRVGSVLRDLASKEIEANLTEENIATETFSVFAARHPDIMATGWKHLNAELKTERTMASTREHIKGMEGGGAVHRADSLKLGLYNALRQRGPDKSALAMLRCTDGKCPASETPIPDRGPGKIYCPEHSSERRAMKCSECGHVRVDHNALCKGCRRLFE